MHSVAGHRYHQGCRASGSGAQATGTASASGAGSGSATCACAELQEFVKHHYANGAGLSDQHRIAALTS